MRKRITYIQQPDAPFEFDQTVLNTDALSIRNLDAVRQERVTVGIEEVPVEFTRILDQCHELHIRWASERGYSARAPFSSRVSVGLNVFVTPSGTGGAGRERRVTGGLCRLLREVFGVDSDSNSGSEEERCLVPEISFTTPPILSEGFVSAPTYQFHTLLPSLDRLVTFIQESVCGKRDETCRAQASSIQSADSLDIDYDSISQTLTATGYWSTPPEGGWTEEIQKHPVGEGQVEVGLLGTERAIEFEELKVGGLLAVVGKDENLKPTLFSFPSRHHPLPDDATYSVSFAPPTGLHPTMTISMPRSSLDRPPADPEATCALHTHLTLPSSIFADKYQLSTADSLFLESHNLVALRAVSGETDLEAPDWMVHRWGSTWLLELATPESNPQEERENWNITIPLHLRYLRPSESGYRTISVPWPVVFWACTAEEETNMAVNPFDRVNLGWDGLFSPQTMFYQLRPSVAADGREGGRLVEEIDVPVLRISDSKGMLFEGRTVEVGTVVVVLLGMVWVLWKLGFVMRVCGVGCEVKKGMKKEKKQKKDE